MDGCRKLLSYLRLLFFDNLCVHTKLIIQGAAHGFGAAVEEVCVDLSCAQPADHGCPYILVPLLYLRGLWYIHYMFSRNFNRLQPNA